MNISNNADGITVSDASLPTGHRHDSEMRVPAGAGRSGLVLTYLSIAFVLLLPGLLSAASDRLDIKLEAPFDVLRGVLDDIHFGGGLRFWLGVAGATMMGSLLLYPLRKVFSGWKWPGNVAAWFNLHLVFGIFGPVLILYHCNFGLGSANANVALWSMIAIFASGLLGHLVYARASTAFYEERARSARQIDCIGDLLKDAAIDAAARQAILDALSKLHDEVLKPRKGVARALLTRIHIEQRRRAVFAMSAAALDGPKNEHYSNHSERLALRAELAAQLRAFFHMLRRGAIGSVREQLWAKWRTFHVPLFCLMIGAVALHVHAVWGIKPPGGTGSRSDAAVSASVAGPPIVQKEREGPRRAAHIDELSMRVAQPPAQDGIAALLAHPDALPEEARSAVGAPAEAPRHVATPRTSAKKSETTAKKASPVAKRTVRTIEVGPQAKTAPPPGPPADAAPTLPTPETTAIYSQLQRTAETMPMALGGAKPRTLADQLSELKARFLAKEFRHSEAETGFALTGRHLKNDCAACHKEPLREARSTSPRQCLACHKSDDVHRGRRPDCARCHRPTGWTDIIK